MKLKSQKTIKALSNRNDIFQPDFCGNFLMPYHLEKLSLHARIQFWNMKIFKLS